jgi:hypothetical protein
MSTAEDRSSQSGRTAVQQAPGLWRTDLQRQDLSVGKGKRLLTLAG